MMKYADKWLFYAMAGGLFLLIGAMMVASAQPAAAQCGTSASSCKSCHETQGQMSVANNGDWHKAHAFGDFCEFCHAGNVQAKDKAAAHQGMVAPLADVKTSCQGCHPDDYAQRAEKYAATLGVKLEAGSGGAASSAPTTTTSADAGDNTTGCVTGTSVSAPTGGEEIDFNLLYTAATAAPPLVSNWGNVILGLLILGTAAAFLVTAWRWENWGQKTAVWINKNVVPLPPNESDLQALLAQKPELQALLPRLMNLSPHWPAYCWRWRQPCCPGARLIRCGRLISGTISLAPVRPARWLCGKLTLAWEWTVNRLPTCPPNCA